MKNTWLLFGQGFADGILATMATVSAGVFAFLLLTFLKLMEHEKKKRGGENTYA